MGKIQYTSIYLPSNLKDQLASKANAEGYSVGKGCKSQLAKFIELILLEYKSSNAGDPRLSSLSPELRSSISKLNELNTAQQQYVGSILKVLLEAFSGL